MNFLKQTSNFIAENKIWTIGVPSGVTGGLCIVGGVLVKENVPVIFGGMIIGMGMLGFKTLEAFDRLENIGVVRQETENKLNTVYKCFLGFALSSSVMTFGLVTDKCPELLLKGLAATWVLNAGLVAGTLIQFHRSAEQELQNLPDKSESYAEKIAVEKYCEQSNGREGPFLV